MTATIWWVRRDLRLRDNFALQAALQNGETVIPAFVLDPALLGRSDAGPKRVAFMLGGLAALDRDLRTRGSRLIVLRGEPAEELARLRGESAAGEVYAEADPWPYARERDRRVGERLPLTLTPGITARPYDRVGKADGSAYTVFTPYSRAWKALPRPAPEELIPAPERLPLPAGIDSLPIPDLPNLPATIPFEPGEEAGLRRLAAFAGGPIYAYGDDRNRMDLDGTSQLSPYLRFGMVSARRGRWWRRCTPWTFGG